MLLHAPTGGAENAQSFASDVSASFEKKVETLNHLREAAEHAQNASLDRARAESKHERPKSPLIPGGITMPVCDHCGNDFDKTFQVTKDGAALTFDSFECAIQRLAPVCEYCKVRIIGHGLESDGRFFCCDHCAEKRGVQSLRDRSAARSACA